MATQTLSIGSFQDGAAEVFCTYDDGTLRLQTVGIRNDGVPFTLTVVLSDRGTGEVFFTRSRSFGQGSVSQNVNGANVRLVMVRDSPHLPFNVSISSS